MSLFNHLWGQLLPSRGLDGPMGRGTGLRMGPRNQQLWEAAGSPVDLDRGALPGAQWAWPALRLRLVHTWG